MSYVYVEPIVLGAVSTIINIVITSIIKGGINTLYPNQNHSLILIPSEEFKHTTKEEIDEWINIIDKEQ